MRDRVNGFARSARKIGLKGTAGSCVKASAMTACLVVARLMDTRLPAMTFALENRVADGD
jgi:hypothetical protein